jgi:hypothetical protein
MHTLTRTRQSPFCHFSRVDRQDILAIMTALLLTLVLSTLATAQAMPPQLVNQDVPLPQVVNVVGVPACAASANMTAHMICVANVSNGQLTAISEAVSNIVIVNPTLFQLDATGFNNLTAGKQNPLPLGINGTVGNSSCSSTADASADVVCAYNSNGLLAGVRFSILANAPNILNILPKSFEMTPIVGNASCAIGAARNSLGVPQGPPPAGTEGLAGETICAFRSTNNELMAVAFNPATPNTVQMQDLGVVATGDPSCVGAVDATNQVICAFITASGLRGIAFDPRTPFKTAVQSLYAGTSFPSNPGCTTPNDNSGQVICAIVSAANTLAGFAFDPRQTYQSTLQSLGTTTMVGTPSCSGFGDGTNRVICAVRSSANVVNTVKFDPRLHPGFSSGLARLNGTTASGDLSCIFLNIHQFQVNCAGVLSSHGELFGIVLAPPALNALIPVLLLL